MDIQDILVIVIVGAAILYVTRSLWRTLGGKGGCHCSQNQSSDGSNSCGSTNPMGIKMTPIVPLGQVGLPQKDKSLPKKNAD